MGRILIVGDLFPVSQNISQFCVGDIENLFGKRVCELFFEADYRICNLEGALTDHAERCQKTGPVVTASTSAIEAYKQLGIDCCMLANNHITDGGHQGVLDTMHTLERAGIHYIGAGKDVNHIIRSLFIELEGIKLCVYNVSETMYNVPTGRRAGAWVYDEYVVCKELESLKAQCDYLVVIYHGGIEKYQYPSPEIRKRFHRMADSGANVILSQHTHCIGCEEFYNGSYLLYGQGDFLFKNFRPEITDKGIAVELCFDNSGMTINKHVVKCSKNLRLEYIENPDFKEFTTRSDMLKDENFIHDKFYSYCEDELHLYLEAFKSPGLLLRITKKFFPLFYKRWLLSKAYTRRNLLFSLHTLRSEQNRETCIGGIERLLGLDMK